MNDPDKVIEFESYFINFRMDFDSDSIFRVREGKFGMVDIMITASIDPLEGMKVLEEVNVHKYAKIRIELFSPDNPMTICSNCRELMPDSEREEATLLPNVFLCPKCRDSIKKRDQQNTDP